MIFGSEASEHSDVFALSLVGQLDAVRGRGPEVAAGLPLIRSLLRVLSEREPVQPL